MSRSARSIRVTGCQHSFSVEIAVQDDAGARSDSRRGRPAVELCQALGLGGLTPSAGSIALAVEAAAAASAPDFVHVLVRPRGGGFVYDADELATIVRDIRLARSLGAHGVVVGALMEAGALDLVSIADFLEAADGIAGHRAPSGRRGPRPARHRGVPGRVRRAACAHLGWRGRLPGGARHARTHGRRGAGARSRSWPAAVCESTTSQPSRRSASTPCTCRRVGARRAWGASGPGGGETGFDVTDAAVVRAAVDAAATNMTAAPATARPEAPEAPEASADHHLRAGAQLAATSITCREPWRPSAPCCSASPSPRSCSPSRGSSPDSSCCLPLQRWEASRAAPRSPCAVGSARIGGRSASSCPVAAGLLSIPRRSRSAPYSAPRRSETGGRGWRPRRWPPRSPTGGCCGIRSTTGGPCSCACSSGSDSRWDRSASCCCSRRGSGRASPVTARLRWPALATSPCSGVAGSVGARRALSCHWGRSRTRTAAALTWSAYLRSSAASIVAVMLGVVVQSARRRTLTRLPRSRLP